MCYVNIFMYLCIVFPPRINPIVHPMKHHGNVVDFTPQRNKELMRNFRKAYSCYPYNGIHNLFERAASLPCSRFWVSEERALLVISQMLKGRPILDVMVPVRREMFQEIFNRTVAMMENQPDRPLSDIVFEVVNSPAPKIYLTPNSFRVTYYKIKQGYYANHGRRFIE